MYFAFGVDVELDVGGGVDVGVVVDIGCDVNVDFVVSFHVECCH